MSPATVESTAPKSILYSAIDYGYEEHIPTLKQTQDIDFSENTSYDVDVTEISQSPSQNHDESNNNNVAFVDCNEQNYPPMPADRMARKQRSFRRRGGAGHSALLKSAVMASMMDHCESSDDGGVPLRRGSCHSNISLQSLQNALRGGSSPRKRLRRVPKRNLTRHPSQEAATTSEDDDEEVSNMFDTLQMSGMSMNARKEPLRREPPIRRVSRKTSYDSRVSDFDSEFSDWEEE